MNKQKSSYQYKQEKIAKLEKRNSELLTLIDSEIKKNVRNENKLSDQIKTLEKRIVVLDGESNRYYQEACHANERLKELREQKTSTVHGGYEREVICEDKPADPYRIFKDAIKEGKTVECKVKNGWYVDRDGYDFILHPDNYRIKPDVYIPFTFEDADILRGQWFKSKSTKSEYQITEVHKDGINLMPFKVFFKLYTFLDGTPCGKLSE